MPSLCTPLIRMKTLASLRIRALFPHVLSSAALLFFGCSDGDLEDKDVYATQVTTGQGAKGVTKPLGSGQNPPTPNPPAVTPTPPATSSPTTAPTTSTPPTPSGGLSEACTDVQTRIFQTRCDGAACHGEPGVPAAAYSDFVTPTDLPAAVRDVPAKSGCSSMKLVDTQNPANSALLKVITATPQPCVSLQMPVGDALSAADAACVTEWVNAVASGAI